MAFRESVNDSAFLKGEMILYCITFFGIGMV